MADFVLLSGDDAVTFTVAAALLLLLVLGVLERRRNRRSLDAVPVRISVNGSRGKSTITRLLLGALSAGGRRTVGKTTGTEPKILLGWSGEEVDLERRPEGPNISEQRLVNRRAADERADAMVVECMAVDPEYQLTFHRDLMEVNLLVICNALQDHLDVMGPTVDDVADVFAQSIPTDGTVVVVPDDYTELYRRVATERGSQLLVADPSAVTEEQLAGFDHLVLDEHVAVALAVTRSLGIDDEVALRGMHEAPVDRYAMRILPVGDPQEPAYFVNGFAVNDPTSTLAVWDHLQERALPSGELTVIVHCRSDRVSRTELFATDVLPKLPIDTLVITGEQTRAILDAVAAGTIDVDDVVDLTDRPPTDAVDKLRDRLSGQIVYGIGNLHGGATELIAAIEDLAVDPSPTRGAA
ncbi:poly-gamma-glutamate synthase PgsB [Egicoccus halophilus]|uniref:PGA synthase CapB n=1 Tax=Egicoccus halophilus TaxID=1670830 RepID=A0A8J3EUD7_9ACTN|nr:poly-gamma-glutamate synthase PgsB [Egicoccus halophilus]GGI06969.1 PGA synthase CapB [Egicoccus halophilus]